MEGALGGAARRVIVRHGSFEEASLTRRTGHATCKGPPLYLLGPCQAGRPGTAHLSLSLSRSLTPLLSFHTNNCSPTKTGCQKKNSLMCSETSPVLYQSRQYIQTKYLQRNRTHEAFPIPDDKHTGIMEHGTNRTGTATRGIAHHQLPHRNAEQASLRIYYA